MASLPQLETLNPSRFDTPAILKSFDSVGSLMADLHAED
jgi:hypothetical protein